MTKTEFQTIFTDIKTAVVDVIKTNAPSAKVYSREIFDESENIWLGRLQNSESKTHCWSVASVGVSDDDSGAVATDCFTAKFRIIGYHYYDFGSNDENSSKKFTDEINAIRFAFANCRTLGLDWVNEHKGFKDKCVLSRIDTQQIHICRVDFDVQLIEIPFEFN